MEWAALQYSSLNVAVPVGGSNSGGTVGAQPGETAPAPAPVVGGSPLGSMLAIGLLGYLGLGRRRAGRSVAA